MMAGEVKSFKKSIPAEGSFYISVKEDVFEFHLNGFKTVICAFTSLSDCLSLFGGSC